MGFDHKTRMVYGALSSVVYRAADPETHCAVGESPSLSFEFQSEVPWPENGHPCVGPNGWSAGLLFFKAGHLFRALFFSLGFFFGCLSPLYCAAFLLFCSVFSFSFSALLLCFFCFSAFLFPCFSVFCFYAASLLFCCFCVSAFLFLLFWICFLAFLFFCFSAFCFSGFLHLFCLLLLISTRTFFVCLSASLLLYFSACLFLFFVSLFSDLCFVFFLPSLLFIYLFPCRSAWLQVQLQLHKEPHQQHKQQEQQIQKAQREQQTQQRQQCNKSNINSKRNRNNYNCNHAPLQLFLFCCCMLSFLPFLVSLRWCKDHDVNELVKKLKFHNAWIINQTGK